jgi:ABC-type Fe3+ transport system permease subunit
MFDLPLAHAGHVVAIVPFFAPPLVLTFGLLVQTIRDRLHRRVTPEETR